MPLPLLLLPGSLCTGMLFQPQISAFKDDREVLVGDFSNCDSIETMATKVLTEAPAEFALAGLSMGGIVAFEMFRQAPERIKKIALLNTNPRSELPENVPARQQQINTIARGGVESLTTLVSQQLMPKYAFDSEQLLKLEPLVMEMALEVGVDEFINQWRALASRPDSWSTLKDIRCPTLILCGIHDALCSEKLHHDMAQEIKHAKLEI
ncbi:MAG: alpha/beta hydrolase, partial [Porticoccaceae bacterium]|nr:alpha/beta hydrolase [Porticoccaceae bacterium]